MIYFGSSRLLFSIPRRIEYRLPREVDISANAPSAVFEILDRLLVRLGCGSCGKRSEVLALSGPGILLARVQTILAGFQLADHFSYLPANSAFLCSRSARFQSRIVTCRGTALLSGGPCLPRQGCMRSRTVTFLFQCLKGCARASR